MAIAPEIVYRNRVALVEEYGFTAHDVLVDGFTSEYFEVIGNRVDGYEHRHLRLSGSGPIVTRIYWGDIATERRARKAMEDDYRETTTE